MQHFPSWLFMLLVSIFIAVSVALRSNLNLHSFTCWVLTRLQVVIYPYISLLVKHHLHFSVRYVYQLRIIDIAVIIFCLLQLYGQLQDLPTILRHIWAEMFTWRGIETITRFRFIVCVVTAVLYAIAPIDLIPEAILGLLGLIDDVVVIAFLLIQVSVVYRTVVANRDW